MSLESIGICLLGILLGLIFVEAVFVMYANYRLSFLVKYRKWRRERNVRRPR